jgi:hypothetical protein
MRPDPAAAAVYAERLWVPLRWWAITTMFWASVLLAFLVALPFAVAIASTAVLVGLNLVVFVSLGRALVAVESGVFRAGRAQIPIDLLAMPEALDREDARKAAGVEADARAYLLLRPYLTRAVRVQVVDPADPTPYWLVSTRRPRTLAAVLSDAIGNTVP